MAVFTPQKKQHALSRYHLLINDSYHFLIGGGNKLIIGSGLHANWTPQVKN